MEIGLENEGKLTKSKRRVVLSSEVNRADIEERSRVDMGNKEG